MTSSTFVSSGSAMLNMVGVAKVTNHTRVILGVYKDGCFSR